MGDSDEERAREIVLRVWHEGRLDGNAADVIAAALSEARAEGVAAERERCVAHLMDFAEWVEKNIEPAANPSHREGQIYAALKMADEIRARSAATAKLVEGRDGGVAGKGEVRKDAAGSSTPGDLSGLPSAPPVAEHPTCRSRSGWHEDWCFPAACKPATESPSPVSAEVKS